MKSYTPLWRAFFAIGIFAIAAQQLLVADFRPVILPPSFPAWLPARLVWTWLISIALIAASVAIIFDIKARPVSLLLGSGLLLLTVLFQVPYELGLYPAHLGVWTDPLKELALSGGAFIVAGTFPEVAISSSLTITPGRLIPAGKYFFAITMAAFGIDHFLYTDFVATLVPSWMPAHVFWTYFAGAALVLAGVAIIANMYARIAAALLGVMIFLWLILLHIPRAIADPHSGNGNEWTSVFEALAFSGIALLVAGGTGYLSRGSNPRATLP